MRSLRARTPRLDISGLRAWPGVPYHHRRVPTRAYDAIALRIEGDRGHATDVALQREDLMAGIRVPEPHRTILPGTGQAAAVVCPGEPPHRAAMAHARAVRGTSGEGRGQVPDSDRTIEPRGCQKGPVARD